LIYEFYLVHENYRSDVHQLNHVSNNSPHERKKISARYPGASAAVS